MNEQQQKKFKTLWKQLEELDQAARQYQLKEKGNQYHAMIADIKGLNITISQAFNVAISEKLDFYDVFLDLLEKKVQLATLMQAGWFE